MKRYCLILYAVIACFLIPASGIAQTTKTCDSKCLSGDCQNGTGTYRFDDCTIYEGHFVNYQLYGQGRYTYASGDRYDGNWKSSKRDGFGKYTWTDGTIYEGYYVDDVMNGQGTIYYANGEKYVGQCYNANREGKGIHYNADGSVYYNGYWKNNIKATEGSGTTSQPVTTPPPASDEDDYSWLDSWLDSVYATPTEEEVTEEDPYDDSEDLITYETTQGTSSGNFCTDYKAIAATSPTYFESLKATMRSEEGDMFKTVIYNTSKKLYGAEDCYIQSIFGTSYYAEFGTYNSLTDAETKFNKLATDIKSCLTSGKLFENVKPETTLIKGLDIITKYDDGFDSYGDRLMLRKNDAGKYEVTLYISTNTWNNRIYVIKTTGGSGDATFDANVKKIMESSRNEFKAVLGEKHVDEGFWGTTTSYDVNASIPGIFDLSYSEGGAFSLGGNQMEGVSYDGTSEADAKKAYTALSEKMKKALGSSYVYRVTDLTDGTSKSTILGLKSEVKDEKIPVVEVEYYYSKSNSKYTVKLNFAYKGFNSLL